MKKLCTLFLILAPLFFYTPLFSQPANDNCATATVLSDVTNWCSAPGAFTNLNATLSNVTNPFCFPDVTHDVWFSFVAVATTLQVTIIGNTAGNPGPGGTLVTPQFVIYEGTCNGTLTDIGCASDGFNKNIVETFSSALTVGQTYYIRVDGRAGKTGTFQLCINNYNAVPDPNSDCPTGVILCDKSPFTVESLVGSGNLKNEIDPSICIQTEFASAWYRWTCKDAGTLAFTITPTNPSDDIDFAVFELPGGIDDCANKKKIRCEAAGENVGQPFPNWEPCTGPTGLSLTETDLDEFPGCATGQNNFVAAIDMVPGRSYALIINNFSNTGNGFSIEFGGTGTFLGPTADFDAAPTLLCQDDQVTFTDVSTSVEGIAKWDWNFGLGATPAKTSGAGPHNVSYQTPGVKSVVLTITSEAGCVVTHIENFTVLPLPEVSATTLDDYCGPDEKTGAILLEGIGGTPPFLYDWNASGNFTPESTLENLETGTYAVVVKDANGCEQLFTFDVNEGLSLEAGVDPVKPPTCNGDSDGSISVSIDIANYPVQYNFGNGLQPDSVLANIPAGTYNVFVVDNQGCEGNFTIVVEDFPVLSSGIDPIDISCFGEVDGSISVLPVGGAGGYTYLWSITDTTSQITGLVAGNYTVTVTDANGCTETATAAIIEPPQIFMELNITDVICFGDATGVIDVLATGGTPPFEYSTDGLDFQTSPSLGSLVAGTYEVVVKDANGCTLTLQTSVEEPPQLIVEAGEDQTVNLGYTAEIRANVSPLFRPVTLSWNPSETLDCIDCKNPTAKPFQTTTYLVTAVDETGCVAVDSVTINVIIIRPVYIPSAFSPNNDGLNDFFTVFGGPAASVVRTFKIFDRWGDLVFDGNNIPLNSEPDGWDGHFKGKPMNPAVFAYFAQVEFIDGEVLLFEGDVTLMR
jgi:gliding motility-associated-like protein